MRRSVFAIPLLFLCGFLNSTTITEFPEGSYLGQGRYVTSVGQEGNYSSYADVYIDEWSAAYLRDGHLTTYNAIFNFSSHGSFDVDVTQFGKAGKKSTHVGRGQCIDSTCHLNVELDHGLLAETVTFFPNENRIERLGSLRYKDQNGAEQMIAWKENMMRIDSDDEDGGVGDGGGDDEDDDDDDYVEDDR